MDLFEQACEITRKKNEEYLRAHDLEFQRRRDEFVKFCRACGYWAMADMVEKFIEEEEAHV